MSEERWNTHPKGKRTLNIIKVITYLTSSINHINQVVLSFVRHRLLKCCREGERDFMSINICLTILNSWIIWVNEMILHKLYSEWRLPWTENNKLMDSITIILPTALNPIRATFLVFTGIAAFKDNEKWRERQAFSANTGGCGQLAGATPTNGQGCRR